MDFQGQRSTLVSVQRGVPQGSILGPLLFIIYVNDLEINLGADRVCLYADDTSLLVKASTRDLRLKKSEVVKREAEEWFSANRLQVNKNKTQTLEFTTNKCEVHKSIKLLGLHVDNKLNWKTHINELANKLSAAVYSIRRIKNISTHQADQV